MVLKKPYAFLIKRFKLIHLILTVLAVYIITKTNAVHSFFGNYIKNHYSAIITPNFKSNFVNPILYISIILLVVILVFMLLLLKVKNKKEKIYTIYFIYYIFLIFAFLYIGSVFNGLEKEVLAPEFAKLLKDLSLLVYLPQIYFIVITTVRALGFNVKQFNFKADIKELEITSSDDEEIEFSVAFDTYKTERNIRRFIREFKYYIKENMFVMLLLLTVFSFVSINYMVKNRNKIKSTNFKLNEVVFFNNIETKILDVVITDVDLKGNKIKKGKYYVLLKMEINNRSNRDIKIDTNKYSLYNETKKQAIIPSIGYSNYFKDYGVSFDLPFVRSTSSYTVVLPYEIDKSELKNKYLFRLYQDVVIKNNIAYPVYTILKLKPIILDQVSTVSDYQLNEQIKFRNSNIGDSEITIKSYAIGKTYTYEYEKCVNETCSKYYDSVTTGVLGSDFDKTLLALTTNFILDDQTEYYKTRRSITSFASDTFKVEYYTDNVRFVVDAEAIQARYNPNIVMLKVPKNIENADIINLLIIIRNKEYIIKLKN